jgi:hypothetical protein
MKVVETVTNADGEFFFSSKYFLDLPVLREVSGPNFLIYKPGYGISGDHSEVPYHLNRNPIYKKELAIFELPTLEKKEDRIKALRDARDWNLDLRNQTPKLNAFIIDEEKYLDFGK